MLYPMSAEIFPGKMDSEPEKRWCLQPQNYSQRLQPSLLPPVDEHDAGPAVNQACGSGGSALGRGVAAAVVVVDNVVVPVVVRGSGGTRGGFADPGSEATRARSSNVGAWRHHFWATPVWH